MKSQGNFYDVVYLNKKPTNPKRSLLKPSRLMVAKKILAKTKKEAKLILEQQMRASTSFDKVVMVIKL